MESTTNDDYRVQDYRFKEFPTLASLRLTAGDFEALAIQGFVCKERRGNRTYYKLRFRVGGKQSVRYIGDEKHATLVGNELAALQSETKLMRILSAKARIANSMIREAKRMIEPTLKANGYVFHGLAIRRPRHRRTGVTSNTIS